MKKVSPLVDRVCTFLDLAGDSGLMIQLYWSSAVKLEKE